MSVILNGVRLFTRKIGKLYLLSRVEPVSRKTMVIFFLLYSEGWGAGQGLINL